MSNSILIALTILTLIVYVFALYGALIFGEYLANKMDGK